MTHERVVHASIKITKSYLINTFGNQDDKVISLTTSMYNSKTAATIFILPSVITELL